MASIAKSQKKLHALNRARVQARGVDLWNPGDMTLLIKHPAKTLEFKPGKTTIHDVWGVDPAKAVELRKAKVFGKAAEAVEKTLLVANAIDMAAHAESSLAEWGLCILTGDERADAAAKAEGAKTFVKRRAVEERRRIDAYRKRTLQFHQDPRNAGNQPPPMTDQEVAAEIWLNKYEKGMMAFKRHVCPFACGFHSDEQGDLELHMERRHAGQVVAEEAQAAAMAPKPKGKSGAKKAPDSVEEEAGVAS